jgi:hypothetical protein
MPIFNVHGPFKVPVYEGKAARTVTSDEGQAFWIKNTSLAKRRGCYVFGIRSGGGVTPIYVGKATKSFKQEVFQPHKLTKYQQALADYLKGTPVLFFLAPPATKGAPNVTSIGELEEFLIQTAVLKNPDLLNVKGTKKADWGIAGIIRGGVGKPSKAAQALKSSLGR